MEEHTIFVGSKTKYVGLFLLPQSVWGLFCLPPKELGVQSGCPPHQHILSISLCPLDPECTQASRVSQPSACPWLWSHCG
jgi:hypothetical protein